MKRNSSDASAQTASPADVFGLIEALSPAIRTWVKTWGLWPVAASLREQLSHMVALWEQQGRPVGPHDSYRMLIPEQFVLKKGRQFQSQALTKDEKRTVREVLAEVRGSMRRWGERPSTFQVGRCYAQAQRILQHRAGGELSYVEGFVVHPSPTPWLHGWLELNGKVIDVTGPRADPSGKSNRSTVIMGEFEGIVGENGRPREYLGIALKREQVFRYSGTPTSWRRPGWTVPRYDSVIEGLLVDPSFDPDALHVG